MDKSDFKEMICNDSYILWLSKFLEIYGEIDDIYFVREHNLSDYDRKNIYYLKYLFLELNKFMVKHEINQNNIFEYTIKYNGCFYHIFYNSEGFSITKRNGDNSKLFVLYDDLKKEYTKNMEYNFKKLKSRVSNTLYNSDLEKINSELFNIKGPTLISGVGGSSVVSDFASKILSKKNHIITRNMEPRDFLYFDFSLYKNVLACSYSGNNYGVELAFLNDLKHYLLASKEYSKENNINLIYKCNDKEKSFISLGATLIPCSILLNYYLGGNIYKIIDSIDNYNFDFDVKCDVFEIFSGYDTSSASKYLESTMVESGIGTAVIHDKYSYCHGRSTFSKLNNNIAIYFDTGTDLDKLLLKEIPKYYKDVVIIKSGSSIMDEYNLLIKCMYLSKYIAEVKKKDLSKIEYNPIVKKLYNYKGNL